MNMTYFNQIKEFCKITIIVELTVQKSSKYKTSEFGTSQGLRWGYVSIKIVKKSSRPFYGKK